MDTSPLRIGYCLSLSGALASNGKTARLARQIWQENTVVGNVKFGASGGWEQPRVLTVQFQNIDSNIISEFKKPSTQVVVYPSETASGRVIYPYRTRSGVPWGGHDNNMSSAGPREIAG